MRGAQVSHHPAQMNDTARIAARDQHLVEPAGSQTRVAVEGFPDEIQVRIGQVIPGGRPPGKTMGLEGVFHGLRVQTQLGGDGAHFPVFGMEEVPDFSFLFR
jgi:hypothetical protein